MTSLQHFISAFNSMVFITFMILYAYQIVYVFVVLFRKKKERDTACICHRYGFLIAARNESAVISQLIDSIRRQDYPAELLSIFVVADNCTDDTAEVARAAGAVVFERNDCTSVGKGYALDYGYRCILREFPENEIEGYFIFDADNLLSRDYVRKMNAVFHRGYSVITSYRNSKNYATNWLTAGYSLWFLRESRYLNQSRMLLNTNCAVSGTGFLVSADVFRENRGWNYTLLTEDIEFSVDCAISNRKVGYADAEFFDEQPETFRQSWTQRLRWAKGFYQVFGKYGGLLLMRWFRNFSFSCYDLLMTIFPALFLTLSCSLINLCVLFYSLLQPTASELVSITLSSLLATVSNFYLTVYVIGLLTTITEWGRINCNVFKKLYYTFTFPLFMFTYIPIAIAALFKKVKWDPIAHNVAKSIDDLQTDEDENV